MAYCPKCGVKVEKDNRPCPLCNFHIPKVNTNEESIERKFPTAKKLETNHVRRVLNRIFIFISLLVLVSISLIFYVDYELNDTFTWSKISSLSVLSGWCLLYLIFGYVKKYYNIIMIAASVALVLCFGIDILNNGLDWFFPLAFPIIIGTAVVGLSYVSLIRTQFVSGFNIIGFFFIAIVVLLMWVNFFIGNHNGDINLIKWVIITGLQLLPIALIMIYIKYGLPERMKNKIARKFHL